MSVLDPATSVLAGRPHRTIRRAGAGLAVAGLLAWTAAVLLTPAMIAAGLAADAAPDIDYDFSQGTERFFRAEAYDLRLAALVVTGVGLWLVAGTLPGPGDGSPPARRPLVRCAAVLLAAHVAALLLPAVTAPAVAVAAGATAALVLTRSARSVDAVPPTSPPGVLPALFAAGLGLGLTILTTASEPSLDPFVLPETGRLRAAVLTLLVLAAVTAACATGPRWVRSRAAVAALVAVGAGAVLGTGSGAQVSYALVDPGLDPDVPSGLAGPLYAVVGATVLGLVLAGHPARPARRVLQVLVALLAGGTALVAVPLLAVPGLLAGYGTALFHGADLGHVPSFAGTGVTYALVLAGAWAAARG